MKLAKMQTDYTRKQIDLVFTFNSTATGETKGTSLSIRRHRVSCQIVSAGFITGSMCSLRIEGMTLSRMNELSQISIGLLAYSPNSVDVYAGDYGTELPHIFSGNITTAFIDYTTAPNVGFVVQALATYNAALIEVPPISFPAGTPVATIMQTIARQADLSFVNHGVTAKMTGAVYYTQTASVQMAKCADAAGIDYHVGMNTLSIWPRNVNADTNAAIVVSAARGMIGYPSYTQGGVRLQTIFNPTLNFRDTIKLESDYAPAAWENRNGQLNALTKDNTRYPPSNGMWVIQTLQHDLQTEEPGGQWFSYIEAQRPDMVGQEAVFGK